MIDPHQSAAPGPPVVSRVEDRIRRVADARHAAADAEVVAFVWDAADVLGARESGLLDFGLRHGLGPSDLVPDCGLDSERTLDRLGATFERTLQARILWNGGRPGCDTLSGLLRRTGIEVCDRGAVDVIDAHAGRCRDCDRRRRTRVPPAALFAALPMAAPPEGAKASAASVLAAAGVPMAGSSSLPPVARAAGSDVVALEPPPWRRTELVSSSRRRRLAHTLAAVAAALALVAGVGQAVAGGRERRADVPAEVAAPATTAPVAGSGAASDDAGAGGGAGPDSVPRARPRGVTPRDRSGDAAAGDAPAGSERSGPDPAASGRAAPDPKAAVDGPGATAATPTIQTFSAEDGRVTWKVSGAGRVKVTGPGLSASSPTGSTAVCPGGSGSGKCDTEGSFSYRIQVFDREGTLVDSRSVTMRMR